MIGLDSNVLLRLFIDDNPAQTEQALRLVARLDEDEPGFVSLIALVETVWTLRRQLLFKRTAIMELVNNLLNSRELRLQESEVVAMALDAMAASKADFADCLIGLLNQKAGCSRTYTFDRRAASGAPGMEPMP